MRKETNTEENPIPITHWDLVGSLQASTYGAGTRGAFRTPVDDTESDPQEKLWARITTRCLTCGMNHRGEC